MSLDMKAFAEAMLEVRPGESVILTPVQGATYISIGYLERAEATTEVERGVDWDYGVCIASTPVVIRSFECKLQERIALVMLP